MTYNLTFNNDLKRFCVAFYEGLLEGIYSGARVAGMIYMAAVIIGIIAKCFGLSDEALLSFAAKRPKTWSALVLTAAASLGWLIHKHNKKSRKQLH